MVIKLVFQILVRVHDAVLPTEHRVGHQLHPGAARDSIPAGGGGRELMDTGTVQSILDVANILSDVQCTVCSRFRELAALERRTVVELRY